MIHWDSYFYDPFNDDNRSGGCNWCYLTQTSNVFHLAHLSISVPEDETSPKLLYVSIIQNISDVSIMLSAFSPLRFQPVVTPFVIPNVSLLIENAFPSDSQDTAY